MVQVDAFEAVVTRIEVRDFSPKEVPNEVKMKVLEAGRMAPSAWNKQPWHFVLVDDKQELAKLASLSQTGGYIKGAAFAVAVLIDKSYPQYNTDAIRCVQGILIAAWGLGLGSCFVGVIDREKVKELLGAPPELHLDDPSFRIHQEDVQGEEGQKAIERYGFSQQVWSPA